MFVGRMIWHRELLQKERVLKGLGDMGSNEARRDRCKLTSTAVGDEHVGVHTFLCLFKNTWGQPRIYKQARGNILACPLTLHLCWRLIQYETKTRKLTLLQYASLTIRCVCTCVYMCAPCSPMRLCHARLSTNPTAVKTWAVLCKSPCDSLLQSFIGTHCVPIPFTHHFLLGGSPGDRQGGLRRGTESAKEKPVRHGGQGHSAGPTD